MSDFEIVATGTWLYDHTQPRRISIHRKPARLANSRWLRGDEIDDWDQPRLDETAPVPETIDGFLYYCFYDVAERIEHLSMQDAKAWADAQPWGPVVWD